MGAELTSNKARRLEFLLAEAQHQDADVVVTCGGEQSNHCRTTALAAARAGLGSVIRPPHHCSARPTKHPPLQAALNFPTLTLGQQLGSRPFEHLHLRCVSPLELRAAVRLLARN